MKKTLVTLLEPYIFVCNFKKFLLLFFLLAKSNPAANKLEFYVRGLFHSLLALKYVFETSFIYLASDEIFLSFSTFVFPVFPFVQKSTDLLGHLETSFALPLYHSAHLNIPITIVYWFVLLSTGICLYFFPNYRDACTLWRIHKIPFIQLNMMRNQMRYIHV